MTPSFTTPPLSNPSPLQRPLRVLHLSAGNLFGGVERLLVTLAAQRGLCTQMEPSFAICFEGILQKQLVDAGCPPTLLGAVRVSRPWTLLSARRRLRAFLREGGFDVAVVHGCWVNYVFAPVLHRQLPVVFWLHNPLGDNGWQERSLQRFPPRLILANSRFTAESTSGVLPSVAVSTLYLPVAPQYESTNRATRRCELGLSEREVAILMAARLERWKGHELLLEALARLRGDDRWVCFIAGGPQRANEEGYLRALKSRAASLGIDNRVRFLGQREDVLALMAAADVFCQPNSGPEPFGMVYIEAMYAGLPLVTTRLGAAVEIFEGTDVATLCPAGDVESIASALEQLIDSPELRRQRGQSGKARASALCDPTRQLCRIHELLHSVSMGAATAGRVERTD